MLVREGFIPHMHVRKKRKKKKKKEREKTDATTNIFYEFWKWDIDML